MTARDHLHDLRWRAANGKVRVQNAWYRAAGRRIDSTRTGLSNARNQRAMERGKRDLPARAADSLRSSLPVVRDRIDTRTGRPNRDARDMGRLSDKSLARMAPARTPRGREGR